MHNVSGALTLAKKQKHLVSYEEEEEKKQKQQKTTTTTARIKNEMK